MKSQIDIFSESEFAIARQFLDASWESVSGNQMVNPNFAWAHIVIGTTNGKLIISSESRELNFEGYWDEYAKLELTADLNNDPANIYPSKFYQSQGEIIRNIWVMRDRLQKYETGEITAEYLADSGLIFELDSQWICITKSGTRNEALRVGYSSNRENLDLGDLQDRWESDILTSYRYSSEWIPITK